ncbi:DUF4436 family protein [Amycolatopsis sp. NPDC059021]|uniref:DUF4436 family protein n=1 Tax=Amycolatopsis sp. NPDC059021 TaxID=3346704 RepID=UPI003671B1CF
MNSKGTAKRGLAGWIRAVIVAAVVLLLTGVSLWVYAVERGNGQSQIVMGEMNAADRVDIAVFAQKVDATAQELSVQVELHPQGRLADGETGAPQQEITVYTNGLKGETLSLKPGKSPGVSDLKIALHDGVVTDYPFDRYKFDFLFAAVAGNQAVPVSVTFTNADSFFKIKPADLKTDGSALTFTAQAGRSTGTMAFAVFIMVFMWGLSLAAVIAAWFAAGGRRGLLWPSLSFMGALLFALVPLRNALPGSPPIGAIADFGAFFMAEALISISLITTVVFGYIVERANAKKEAAEQQPEPPAQGPPPMAMTAPLAPVGPVVQQGHQSGWPGQHFPR